MGMIARKALVYSCAAILLLPLPFVRSLALAQSGSLPLAHTSPGQSTSASLDGTETMKLFAAFSQCAISRAPEVADRYLRSTYGSTEWIKLGQRLASGACLRNMTLRVSPILLRGAIYSAVYRRDYSTVAPTAAQRSGVIDYDKDFEGTREFKELWLEQRTLAACVYKNDADQVRAYLLSEIGSSEEDTALASLAASVRTCNSGSEAMNLSKQSLRSLLAEVAVRLARLAADPEASRSR
jgi:hypothetical protein